MTTDLDVLPIEQPRRLRLDWLGPAFFSPRDTLGRVLENSYSTWLVPLLLLTLLAVAAALIASPLRAAAAAAAPLNLPQDFQYWAPEQQNQYLQSIAAASSQTYTLVLPLIGDLLKIWLGWFLLAAILHLVLTLAGSRGTMTSALNLVAWASIPLAVRYAVQIASMLISHQVIGHPGLSGFAAETGGALTRYLGAILPFIDLYLVWIAILLLVALNPGAGIPAGKVWMAVLVSVAILLLLEGLPGFLSAQLNGLGGTGGFRFFGL